MLLLKRSILLVMAITYMATAASSPAPSLGMKDELMKSEDESQERFVTANLVQGDEKMKNLRKKPAALENPEGLDGKEEGAKMTETKVKKMRGRTVQHRETEDETMETEDETTTGNHVEDRHSKTVNETTDRDERREDANADKDEGTLKEPEKDGKRVKERAKAKTEEEKEKMMKESKEADAKGTRNQDKVENEEDTDEAKELEQGTDKTEREPLPERSEPKDNMKKEGVPEEAAKTRTVGDDLITAHDLFFEFAGDIKDMIGAQGDKDQEMLARSTPEDLTEEEEEELEDVGHCHPRMNFKCKENPSKAEGEFKDRSDEDACVDDCPKIDRSFEIRTDLHGKDDLKDLDKKDDDFFAFARKLFSWAL